MNREILFRGKRDPKYGTGWCYGVPYTDHEGDCIMATSNSQRVVIEDTVGQYTGLTDRNGAKIFEDDIVSGYFNHEKVKGVIMYCSDAAFYISRDGLYSIGLNNAADWLEVIGNIHDNPEMMKGEENA